MATEYVEVSLSGGQTVKVYPVPPFIVNLALSKFPEPQPPMRKVNPEAAIPGVTDDQTLPDPDNAEYKRLHAEWQSKRTETFLDARLLYGLRDEQPPASWPTVADVELWDFTGIKPNIPENTVGKRLAWIKYGLLRSGADMDKVVAAMDAFTSADSEEIKQLIESFRHRS